MPVSRRQFEAGLTDEMVRWMRLTHEFLSAHKESAYQEDEIRDELGRQLAQRTQIVFKSPLSGGDQPGTPVVDLGEVPYPFTRDDLKAFHAGLRKLAELKAVQAKLAGGVRHYAYSQELPNLD